MPATWPEDLDGPLTSMRNRNWIEDAPAALRGIRERAQFHSGVASKSPGALPDIGDAWLDD